MKKNILILLAVSLTTFCVLLWLDWRIAICVGILVGINNISIRMGTTSQIKAALLQKKLIDELKDLEFKPVEDEKK